MEFKDITTWTVTDCKATPKNPYNNSKDCIIGESKLIENLHRSLTRQINHNDFETLATQHTYPTSLPPGEYIAEDVELVWQYEIMGIWQNNHGEPKSENKRQFLQLKQPVGEQEVIYNIDTTKKVNAVTYDQLLTLSWDREYNHKFKPGYDNSDGDTKYFGTWTKGKRIISVNADYAGHTFVKIMEDGGTRTVFNGHVRSFEELKLINDLVL